MGSINMDDYETLGCLHDMFREQVKKTPSKTAVVSDDGRQLTFQELDGVTDRLSEYLRVLGVKPDSIVGIYMERCLEYVIAYIAILKAGAAYMPIDVSYPTPLLEDILADAKPVAICAEQAVLQNIKDRKNVIVMNKTWQQRVEKELEAVEMFPEPPPVTLDNLAYTVYSSGTTGKPKGIQCPHRGAVFSYSHRHQAFPYQEDDREACNVFFVWEMLRPLLKGVTLYIIPDSVIYDARKLVDYFKKNQITRVLFTPSLLEAVLDAEVDSDHFSESVTSLRTILFCGEVVTTGLLERCVKAFPQVQFVNLYSVSESHDIACVDLSQWISSVKDIKSLKFCPVGKVLPGVHVVILDDDFKPQPMGVPGEIYVGGPTLARCYLNRPELNSKRFIARPKSVSEKAGGRLYKTGDWGYMLSDGSFEICGRCDSMVKVRGYSIEVQAVEAALLELAVVSTCVVLVSGEEGEDKFLVAYIVPEGKTTKKEVRALLKKRLPFYMVPSYFVFLNSIPILASSGKLDKKALPAVEKSEVVDAEGMPTTETESTLATLWAEALQLKSVDIQESFFDLGGHSLLATRLLTRVSEQLGVELSVRDLFTYPTVFSMARMIDAKLNEVSLDLSGEDRLDLQKEAERHDQAMPSVDMQLRAFWRSMRFEERWEKARVLLTGATGFLGAFLLRELLRETKTHVYCLVRELPDLDARSRVKLALQQYSILAAGDVTPTEEQVAMDSHFTSRVTAIRGDVGLVNMGLPEDDYTYMCTEIDFVIHAAAVVNLIYPYQALHGPNVLGTQNVLRFACSSKIKPVHYISTDAVYPAGMSEVPEDYNMSLCADKLTDGYSQSKWVAEQLVLKAMDKGLPATVYRPGNLSGDRAEGRWNRQDFNLLMLQGCLHTQSAPAIKWDVEFTPVDFVTQLVISLTKTMSLGLGKVFNVVNNKPIKSQWLFEWISAHGYPLEMIPYQDWLKRVKDVSSNNKDLALLERILDTISDESWFADLTTYRNENLYKVLETLSLDYPDISDKLLKSYFYGLAKQKLIPRVRKKTTLERPLSGKVAIVTGASSGIGAAVSIHLARAGASVAMAARRKEKLDEQKKLIEAFGGVAIAIKCDVVSREQVKEMVHHTESVLGPVNILVNSAGVMYYTMMKNLNEEQWDRQVDINCKGVLNCIGATLDGMLARSQGHIVNISSNAGRRGFAGLAVYSGTKFFVEGLSQGMRSELAKTGVKVTCIQPGDVRTELLTHTTDTEAAAAYDGSQSTKILEPDDIGQAVLYAVTQPAYAAVNEILIEPREAPI